jgi:thioredoxin-related protein
VLEAILGSGEGRRLAARPRSGAWRRMARRGDAETVFWRAPQIFEAACTAHSPAQSRPAAGGPGNAAPASGVFSRQAHQAPAVPQAHLIPGDRSGSMRLIFVVLSAVLFAVAAPVPAAQTPGKMTGGQKYDLPAWFKMSFLDLPQDAREAAAQGRQLMLFLHLEECPYCARMLEENFREGATKEFIERHFDVIALDVRGSRTVTWFDGRQYPEEALAQKIKVFGTPTILFLDPEGNIVLRLNGYRQRAAFRQALEYVQQQDYRRESLASFVEKQKQTRYRLRPEPMFREMTDFRGFHRPLAVIFEDRDCTDCEEFHERVLNHPDVLPELARFTVVRLDAYSDQPITDLDGRRTTPRQWVTRLGLTYRPGIVLFNEGKERARMDGMLYHFHFKELLRYVSGEHYKRYASFSKYNAARRDALLREGVNIDYAE